MLAECVTGYSTVRGLLWEGEKAATRYFQAHDSEYLATLTRCVQETDRTRRFALYEELARRTLDPVGGLWGRHRTAFAYDGTAEECTSEIATAHRLWNDLIGDDLA
jgi:hypothetical protein